MHAIILIKVPWIPGKICVYCQNKISLLSHAFVFILFILLISLFIFYAISPLVYCANDPLLSSAQTKNEKKNLVLLAKTNIPPCFQVSWNITSWKEISFMPIFIKKCLQISENNKSMTFNSQSNNMCVVVTLMKS